jgi:putative tricarboxylic transport membrane protein
LHTLEAAVEGAALLFTWPNVLYPIVGTLLAMIFSVLPGLSGVTLMALAIPLTLRWEPVPFVLLFGAFTGGATFMGSVTAILFGVPGRNSNAATVLDGHPLALSGEAKTAIACSATASALGSTIGVLILVALIPAMIELTLAFGPLEILMVSLWGLSSIAALVRGSIVKGWSMACFGLLLSFIGYDGRTAELRYTFGVPYLQDGLSLVPVFLGLFAMTAAIDLSASGRTTISGATSHTQLKGSVGKGVRSVFEHFGLFVRSSLLGTAVGLVPGIGATVASLVAYGHAARTVERQGGALGQGDLRGVIAPEAANDAKDGGALVPTLAFGIPGGAATALLLGALALHGITPGQQLLDDRLPLVFALVWSLFLSNWLTSLFGLAAVGPLSRLTIVPTHWLVPLILTLASVGAFVYRGRIGDVVVACLFGTFGFLAMRLGWPRVPLVVGLVLGPVFESNFHLARRLSDLGRISLGSSPIAMSLLLLTLLGALAPLARNARARRREKP